MYKKSTSFSSVANSSFFQLFLFLISLDPISALPVPPVNPNLLVPSMRQSPLLRLVVEMPLLSEKKAEISCGVLPLMRDVLFQAYWKFFFDHLFVFKELRRVFEGVI